MKRAVAGVIVGYLLWTALWLGGNALWFGAAGEIVKAGRPYAAVGPLLWLIVLSVVCSLAAGIAAALISRARARGAVLVMAVLLLGTGVAVQVGIGSLMPVWYHLAFLALIVPMAVLGARLGRRIA
jgi:hypothetical protein